MAFAPPPSRYLDVERSAQCNIDKTCSRHGQNELKSLSRYARRKCRESSQEGLCLGRRRGSVAARSPRGTSTSP